MSTGNARLSCSSLLPAWLPAFCRSIGEIGVGCFGFFALEDGSKSWMCGNYGATYNLHRCTRARILDDDEIALPQKVIGVNVEDVEAPKEPEDARLGLK